MSNYLKLLKTHNCCFHTAEVGYNDLLMS